MTRPTIVRADTIDLQDPVAPSAQDHSRSRLAAANNASSSNSLSPHQAETIREVSHDAADEQSRSPRISWEDNGKPIGDIHQFAEDLGPTRSTLEDDSDDEHGKMSQEDALAIAQNGGISSSDEGDLDGDADDLDDDMMDKISSSPSIEDGGCCPVITPVAWPRRVSSLPHALRNAPQHLRGSSGPRPPSPYPDLLKHMPSHSPHPKLPRALPMTSMGGDKVIRGEEVVLENMENEVFYDCTETADHSDCTDDKTTDREYIPASSANDDYDGMALTFPYEESFEDDDDSDLSFPDDTNYIDSGWAPECLQDIEDIDFEFVYALHTFIATVEGQANATKGDTMVLLDDSNSYWWLVRVVKDSSIGYLPAEHIETPTERLARLNKHRNVDLSATMLGDQAEKKPQTFKSAIRTIKRKTVAFAPPTYVDYSDFDDYSTDEEDLDELFAGHTSSSQQSTREEDKKDSQENQSVMEDDTTSEDSARVEPLKPRMNKEVRLVEPSVETVVEEDETRNSEEILLDTKLEPSRSRNGTVRNTDSFFKDETVETKKITLTPNLLRDDNQPPRQSTESVTVKDTKTRPSLDKELMSDKETKKLKDKNRKEKEKEKKPSAIRSFFSRKDKKKTTDDDDDSFGKRSMDMQSDSAGRSSESPSIEEQTTEKPQRSPSKLQKQMPRVEPSANRAAGEKTGPSPTMELVAYLNESRTNDVSNVPPATMRLVDSETNETQELPSNHANAARERSASAAAQREEKAAVSKVSRSASTGAETKSHKSTRTRPKTDLDDFSSDDDLGVEPETRATTGPTEGPQVPGAFPETDSVVTLSEPAATVGKSQQQSRLSESPVQVSPVPGSQPPALEIDTSSLEGRSSEEVPSPELSHGEELSKDSGSTRSGKEPGWDDEKLRAFFDEGDHVRDLLMVVYDKSDAEPVNEHPVVSGLFREQNAKLAEITTQLDNMLGDWLARKQRSRGKDSGCIIRRHVSVRGKTSEESARGHGHTRQMAQITLREDEYGRHCHDERFIGSFHTRP
ncbi:hypothetical protein B0T10DRAFT_527806 [Thelonectria olida]|uniref:SH3 domain-containing protein n=1 Tax=Thelonectria olida TaxID=1576542 RepID=A0A9P8WAA2_9HYPO|nr:hypothetical protein B0T10DRAFT_527806 [Thelonectria olida]